MDALTAAAPPGALMPRYDVAHLSWQLGRCPVVECWTLMSTPEEPEAGAVVWRARRSEVDWRMALWSHAQPHGSHGSLAAVVRAAIRLVYDGGGEVVSRSCRGSIS
jgi:hypothetical protein